MSRKPPTPVADHIPVPPDQDHGAPVRIPPDQPGLPEEDQPDPPPTGDPSPNEPTRLLAESIIKDKHQSKRGGRRILTAASICFLCACAMTVGTPLVRIQPTSAFVQAAGSASTQSAAPTLWREPTDIETRDLLLGPGGSKLQPDLKRVTFKKKKEGGYSQKYDVVDGAGAKWVVKVGKEAQSEVAAGRLLWAVGFFGEISYLVPQVTIDGVGSVTNARFEARPANQSRVGEWKWDDNPFARTLQLQGLKVMMIFLNNWDIKDSNNQIVLTTDEAGNPELHYLISDLGGTLGETGNFITRSRNNPHDFAKAEFVDGIKGGYVDFHYSGKRKAIFEKITLGEARWMAGWLARLSDRQIQDAFRAANYRPDQVELLTESVRARINELVNITRQM